MRGVRWCLPNSRYRDPVLPVSSSAGRTLGRCRPVRVAGAKIPKTLASATAAARLAALNDTLQERHGVALELRIGINTGEVMAATEPRPGEALATGDAVNAAARLEQAAEPGAVLVSERTARAARGFRFVPARLLELRGKGEGLRAVELLAEQAIAEGALPGRRGPLGRRRPRPQPLPAT